LTSGSAAAVVKSVDMLQRGFRAESKGRRVMERHRRGQVPSQDVAASGDAPDDAAKVVRRCLRRWSLIRSQLAPSLVRDDTDSGTEGGGDAVADAAAGDPPVPPVDPAADGSGAASSGGTVGDAQHDVAPAADVSGAAAADGQRLGDGGGDGGDGGGGAHTGTNGTSGADGSHGAPAAADAARAPIDSLTRQGRLSASLSMPVRGANIDADADADVDMNDDGYGYDDGFGVDAWDGDLSEFSGDFFPLKILTMLSTYLQPHEAARCCEVSRAWFVQLDGDDRWRDLFQASFWHSDEVGHGRCVPLVSSPRRSSSRTLSHSRALPLSHALLLSFVSIRLSLILSCLSCFFPPHSRVPRASHLICPRRLAHARARTV
jgi:hypothetical protein